MSADNSPTPFRFLARMADPIKFDVPGIFRLGVVDIRRPKSIRYLDGI